MSTQDAAPSMQQGDHHFRNIVLIWLVANAIMLPIMIWVLGPGLPPGNGTVQSHGQVVDNIVLFAIATPVALAVLVYFGYALWVFRERTPEVIVDGPPIRGNATVQFWWLATTITLVLFLAGYGTDRLLVDGAGGGQGPNPISVPKAPDGHELTVQVIAQQWEFTYRYPAYGGVETRFLELPENTLVRFNVTSLDVIHSFWAYQLGVKADATPGENNVAYVTTLGPLSFNVRCAELCGVWHGYMFNSGSVVPKTQFASWIAQQQSHYAPATKTLGPVSKTYFPQPLRRGG
jgi:cytochrome c oxidase subunit 2